MYIVGSDYVNAKKRHGDVPETRFYYETIDGNWTNHPVAFCHHYRCALTRGLMRTHKCNERECKRLDKNYKFE